MRWHGQGRPTLDLVFFFFQYNIFGGLLFDCISESEYEFVCCFLELQSELAGCYESEFELF